MPERKKAREVNLVILHVVCLRPLADSSISQGDSKRSQVAEKLSW